MKALVFHKFRNIYKDNTLDYEYKLFNYFKYFCTKEL